MINPEETAGETLEEDGRSGGPVFAATPHLFVVVEGDRPTSGGARCSLAGLDEVIIGRGRDRTTTRERAGGKNRLIVQVPGKWMSSVHARLVRSRGAWVLEDAGSRNGTVLNGESVQRRSLVDGDVLEAGHTVFVYRDALPTPPGIADDTDSRSMTALAPGLRTLLPALAHRLHDLARVAGSDVSIVLTGETGTGKEVLARAAHSLSGRRGDFVAINCGGLSAALVEGLLYGHTKGSFTGAARDELGFVRAAHEGTLFLDEIGDFPPAAQPSLLRVLQEREVVPLGASRPVSVDLRVVAATHRDLDALVASGNFRQDLLMRLEGFRYGLVPLRDRTVDLGLLLAELLPRRLRDRADVVTLTGAAVRAILAYPWPGNVRELEQVLGRALALARGTMIDVSELGLPTRSVVEPEAPDPADAALREEVVSALARHEGNVSEVAREMGKARMQVQRWMQRFGVDPEAYRRKQ